MKDVSRREFLKTLCLGITVAALQNLPMTTAFADSAISKTKIISKRFAFLLFSYLIILNFKGVPDYNFLLFIFLAYYIRNEKVIRNETASCHFIS